MLAGAATWGAGIYIYNALVCGVGDIRGGRPSAIDNMLAGGILGGIGQACISLVHLSLSVVSCVGVHSGHLDVPFLPGDVQYQAMRSGIPRFAQVLPD